jgi:hypothetical protein
MDMNKKRCQAEKLSRSWTDGPIREKDKYVFRLYRSQDNQKYERDT